MKYLGAAICLFSIFFFASCKSNGRVKTDSQAPPKILWAWERAEDLRFLDGSKFGVAFLAQTVFLQTDEVALRPRRQPLEIADDTYLIAVTRIETNKESEASRPRFSDEQKRRIVSLVENTLRLPNVKAVQIDFDAAVSERNFYKNLIVDLRERLPENFPLSMTALASWCVGGNGWLDDFPIDEAVPMAFRMGADSSTVRFFLASGKDWNEPLCRGSYGVSLDEPFDIKFRENRRVYYFNRRAWQKSDLDKLR